MTTDTNPPLDKDLVARIATSVSNIKPYDDLEAEHIQDIVDWLNTDVNPFRLKKPDVPAKHLVSYFVLVDPLQKSLLLVDHIKAQLWLPTGGHVIYNEDPRQTVVREADEELGVEVVFLKGDDQPFFVTVTTTVGLTPGHVDVSLWYAIRGSIFDKMTFDRSEFSDIEWYTFDEVLSTDPTIFDPHLQRFTQKLAMHVQ